MQRERSAKLGTWGASTVALALSCAGCLVTSELDFQPDDAPPVVKALDPAAISVVPPDNGSDECGFGTRNLYFNASYYDEDVDQTLYVVPLVNGHPILANALLAKPDPNGTGYHALPPQNPLCVPYDLLLEDCNVVQLFVSDNGDLFSRPDITTLKDHLHVSYLEWHVISSAKGSQGADGKGYVGVTDCEPPDGGR
jgi:hypothetical protein